MIGTQIGKFRIVRKLGEGGMGAVYLAHHEVLGTSWVVKTLLPQWTADLTMVQRFINEAKAASSIQHPSIIEIADCNQLPDGSWYIIMQYLDGGTLERFLSSQGGPVSAHLAVQILGPVAAGLDAAHERGIIHCDLKPENIYLIRKGANPHHPVVLDFGIARITGQSSGVNTAVGMIAGTLAYMAPEQIYDRRKVDRRSDVYALGVIAYRMVTGWLPFQRPDDPGAFYELSHTAIYELQKTSAPIDPRQRGAAISDRFASAVNAALHFDPARRPATTSAFALLAAQSTEGDAFQPSGVEILRDVAPELLNVGNLTETLRNPKARNPDKGRYQLGAKIAEGGMAEVFHATMTGAEGFTRTVAIKRILPGFSNQPRFAQMFTQEAQIAALLSHPNIVTVFEFSRDDEDRLFLVLEFIDGVDLHRLLGSGPVSPALAIFIVGEVLAALSYAHNLPTAGPVRGVVHRDISPHNVLISRGGLVKLSDFGLAKAREATEASGSEILKGKPAYMSPEQVNGAPLDGRSDLFALGTVLWEMLTGERLFWLRDAQTTLARVLQRPIPRPSVLQPVPADLEAVVMRLLERDLGARYANAADALDELQRCASASTRSRGDLARTIAERFPPSSAPASAPSLASAAPPRADSGAALVPTPAAATAQLRPAVPPPPPAPRVTSVSGAASERVTPRTVLMGRRRFTWIPAVGGVVTVAGVIAFAAFRGGASDPVSAPIAAPLARPAAATGAAPLAVGSGYADPPAPQIVPELAHPAAVVSADAGVPPAAASAPADARSDPQRSTAAPPTPTHLAKPTPTAPTRRAAQPRADAEDVGGD